MQSKLKSLTYRERQFVDALFLTTPVMNGAEAARAVGFSVASCRVQAVRLLTKDNVQAAIEQRKQEIEKKAEITRDEWLKKGRRFYHGDVRKLFDAHGNPINIPSLGDNEASLIEGFEMVEDFTKVKKNETGEEQAVCTGYTKKFKLVSPLRAHEYFGKILGYYADKVEHSGTLTLEQAVMASMAPETKPK
ncbi:MAG: terminase small subunit [Nitrospiraceae bacterium]|nr:terminase small subunit [Nitrospiraceae bacterium]